jgi:hypothetical protein
LPIIWNAFLQLCCSLGVVIRPMYLAAVALDD